MIIDENECPVTAELSVQGFSESVERHMKLKKFDSYLTCIVDLCNELDIEFKEVNKLMSPALKDKIKLEGEEQGMLKRSSSPMFKFE